MSKTGCILASPHERLLTGRVPEECTEGAVELLRRCLRLKPQERPTAAEAAEAIHALAEAIHALAAAPAPRIQAIRRKL